MVFKQWEYFEFLLIVEILCLKYRLSCDPASACFIFRKAFLFKGCSLIKDKNDYKICE